MAFIARETGFTLSQWAGGPAALGNCGLTRRVRGLLYLTANWGGDAGRGGGETPGTWRRGGERDGLRIRGLQEGEEILKRIIGGKGLNRQQEKGGLNQGRDLAGEERRGRGAISFLPGGKKV